MSDRSHPDDVNVDLDLRNALGSLPLASPSSGVWSDLHRELVAQSIIVSKSQKPKKYYAWAAALAASVLVALLWLPGRSPAPSDTISHAESPSMPSVANVPATLDELRAESQRIETWLRQLSAGGAALNGQDLMAATEIEDLIGMVDLQLGADATEERDSASLWKQRVALLHDLAAIRATTYSLAISDAGAASGEAASPSWIN